VRPAVGHDVRVSSTARPAAGGGRWVDVPPERLSRWLDGFAERHGPFRTERGDDAVTLTADDGVVATLRVPFPPVTLAGPALSSLIVHARQDRRIGVLLVRLGGYAAGIFDGATLVTSKVDSRLVHGRHKKGGSSQQRFARRRDNEERDLIAHAADVAARILLPEAGHLDGLVVGGDRRAVEAVLADRRLAPLLPKVVEPFLTVPDPKRAVLESTPPMYRAVRVHLSA
jgi:hypothetical protein